VLIYPILLLYQPLLAANLENGEEYLRLPSEKKSNFICKLLLEFPIMKTIFLELSTDPKKVITKQDIIDLLKRKSPIDDDTLSRRACTITSWFK
jgi:hypothetical protein